MGAIYNERSIRYFCQHGHSLVEKKLGKHSFTLLAVEKGHAKKSQ